MKHITLNNNIKIPAIGYGVWQIEENIEQCVLAALECGYRHIDTASAYGNEAGVGKAIKESGIPRKELFITTKLWNDDMRADRTKEAFEESLERLGLDYVDLYLTHWPVKNKYIKSYLEMEKLYERGLIKAIGVSNCLQHHLDDLLEKCGIVPAVNQIQIHPRWNQAAFIQYCLNKGIAVEAYSPLGNGNLIGDTEIEEIARLYNRSTAQIIIRWHLQRGVIVLPKSATLTRIRENINVFNFTLKEEHMERINQMNDDTCYGGHPDTFTF
ncbi:MAG: aldo/keto reductase [Clostridiaceae bacterium]|jgi:diketogulonate reductase-like aldo/keto reductase|nr:aldo/keto reductase [Clostridiaceae bacterium]